MADRETAWSDTNNARALKVSGTASTGSSVGTVHTSEVRSRVESAITCLPSMNSFLQRLSQFITAWINAMLAGSPEPHGTCRFPLNAKQLE